MSCISKMLAFRSYVKLPEGNPRTNRIFEALIPCLLAPCCGALISDGQQDTMATLVQRQLRGVLTEGTNVKMSYDL